MNIRNSKNLYIMIYKFFSIFLNVITFSSSLHPFIFTLIVAGNVRGMYSILVIRYFNPHHYLLLWLLLATLLYLDIGNVLQSLALFLALSANLICHFLFWASAKICGHDLTRTIPVQSVFWTDPFPHI